MVVTSSSLTDLASLPRLQFYKVCLLKGWKNSSNAIITCKIKVIPCWSIILPNLVVITVMEAKIKSWILFTWPRGSINIFTFWLTSVGVCLLFCHVWLWESFWNWKQSHKYWPHNIKKKYVSSFSDSQRHQSQWSSCLMGFYDKQYQMVWTSQ